MMPLTVAAAASTESNAHSIVATAGGSGVSRTATRVAMPIVPSEPTKQPAEVVAGRVGLEAAEHATCAVGEHDVDREHVRRRDARPPGSAGRRRWWRRCRRSCRPAATTDRARSAARGGATARDEVEVEHAGLDPRDPCVRVDLEHAVHLGRDDHDRVVERRRAAGEAGAAARAPRTAGRAGARRAPRPRPRRSTAASTPRARAPSRTPASRAYSASSSGSALARCRTERGAQIGEELRRLVRSLERYRLPQPTRARCTTSARPA